MLKKVKENDEQREANIQLNEKVEAFLKAGDKFSKTLQLEQNIFLR